QGTSGDAGDLRPGRRGSCLGSRGGGCQLSNSSREKRRPRASDKAGGSLASELYRGRQPGRETASPKFRAGGGKFRQVSWLPLAKRPGNRDDIGRATYLRRPPGENRFVEF